MERTQIQKKTSPVTKIPLIAECKEKLKIIFTLINLKNKILAYSAIKIRANPVDAYSMLNPDTNSDSPSAKSKGVRLDSANIEIIHKHKIGGMTITKDKSFNINLISINLFLSTKISILIIINANLIS